MDNNLDDETFYITQYQEVVLKFVENEYCAKHRRVPVNKLETVPTSNLVPSATASGSDRAACLLAAAKLCLNSPPEPLKNWGQINPNHNDYHSGLMEISSRV
jgi:hypothetical protein